MPIDPPKSSTPRFDIDPLRGYVCLSLVILHFYFGVLHDAFNRLWGEIGKYIVWNVRLGVESFFILAGLLLAHSLRPSPGESVSVGGYLKRRIMRLAIPYWIAVLIAAIDLWAMQKVFHANVTPPDAKKILTQALFVEEFFYPPEQATGAATGYWSMVVLEQFYLMWILGFWLTHLCLARSKQPVVSGTAERIMAWPTVWLCLGSAAIHLLDYDTPYRFPRYAMYLSLGMLLYWAVRMGFAKPQFWIGCGALVVVAVVSAVSIPSAHSVAPSRHIAACIAVALLIPLARGTYLPRWMVIRGLAYLGKRSYSIYLIHAIVGVRFLSLGKRFLERGDWFAVPLLLTAIVVSIIAALVFYRLVERPCWYRAQSISYRQERSKAEG